MYGRLRVGTVHALRGAMTKKKLTVRKDTLRRLSIRQLDGVAAAGTKDDLTSVLSNYFPCAKADKQP
jgi:hypothetical protein